MLQIEKTHNLIKKKVLYRNHGIQVTKNNYALILLILEVLYTREGLQLGFINLTAKKNPKVTKNWLKNKMLLII